MRDLVTIGIILVFVVSTCEVAMVSEISHILVEQLSLDYEGEMPRNH